MAEKFAQSGRSVVQFVKLNLLPCVALMKLRQTHKLNYDEKKSMVFVSFFNRPGVAGAVLQTAL